MLISVHLPKTAGTSFRTSLEEHFGERLLRDYNDRPIHVPRFRRHRRAVWNSLQNWRKDFGAIECIHGHFLPLKYLSLRFSRKARFVTWLRDPTERVVSNYYYFQRTYKPTTPSWLQRRMVEEEWSLERFCLCPALRNFYCQFLWGVPLWCFDFVGVVEHYEEDLAVFARTILGAPLAPCREKVNPAREQKGYELPLELRAKIESYHAKDTALYRRVLRRRKARMSR